MIQARPSEAPRLHTTNKRARTTLMDIFTYSSRLGPIRVNTVWGATINNVTDRMHSLTDIVMGTKISDTCKLIEKEQ